MFDVIIIGGGPAGLSAAIWCGDLGLKYCLIERSSEFGGQLDWIHLPIKNYPGVPSIGSTEFLKNLVSGLQGDSTLRLGIDVSGVQLEPLSISIDEEPVEARSLILATGVRRRELGVPGEREFAGKGILSSGSQDPEAVSGQTVVIVGGGDAALENANILAPYAEKVFVVHRRTTFSARPEFVENAQARKNVEFLMGSVVESFIGDEELKAVRVLKTEESVTTQIPASKALIRIGVVPNSEAFRHIVTTDRSGYIEIDSTCRTNVEGIFAVGDVACPVSPTIATAVGMGATAAKGISLEFRF
jgi:thioredoxin reductase (NADPH)